MDSIPPARSVARHTPGWPCAKASSPVANLSSASISIVAAYPHAIQRVHGAPRKIAQSFGAGGPINNRRRIAPISIRVVLLR
jgi:hypothetical protein